METAEDCPLAPRNRDNVPDFRQGLEAPAWLLVGQDGLDCYISSRPMREAITYMAAHPVELPQYPEAALLSSSPSTIVGHGNPSLSVPPAVSTSHYPQFLVGISGYLQVISSNFLCFSGVFLI